MGTSDSTILRAREKTRQIASQTKQFEKERVALQTDLRDTQALARDLLRGIEANQ